MSNEFTNKTLTIFASNMSVLATPEGIQKYILGTKKNGQPRAVYDIVKDCQKMEKKSKKKGKKKKNISDNSYSFYLNMKDGKKSKKKKKKKNKSDKYWHI